MDTRSFNSDSNINSLAASTLASFFGYESFSSLLSSSSRFCADITRNSVSDLVLDDSFGADVQSVENYTYDTLLNLVFSGFFSQDNESNPAAEFSRESLSASFAKGQRFVSNSFSCLRNRMSCRKVLSCGLREENGSLYAECLLVDITEYYDKQNLLRHRAEYDPLTGLYNRNAMDNYIADFFNSYPEGEVAIVLVDVNSLRQFNDIYGHYVGDALLGCVGRELIRCLGRDSIIGRNSVDSFLVLLKNRTAQEIDDELKAFSEAMHCMEKDGRIYEYNYSIGYALYPQQGIMYSDLARKASVAIGQLKAVGRNGYKKYEEGAKRELSQTASAANKA